MDLIFKGLQCLCILLPHCIKWCKERDKKNKVHSTDSRPTSNVQVTSQEPVTEDTQKHDNGKAAEQPS
ncbi:hypothetical protein CHS0354_000884 [Potamilus streckersoni]|uniref:Uncharacterized protein n=2 Tax=Potamilus streckersoni TaxID=2493646 RepID=A0AAE0VN47_9BIVA|nr:hypothetical protein CHS0354_000884 [Potamilus streckersoni]